MHHLSRHRSPFMLTILTLASLAGPAFSDSGGPPKVVAPTTDKDEKMLQPPAHLADSEDFVVAKTPPQITFSTLDGLPRLTEETGGLWCSWGQGAYASNGKLYVGIGDHRGVDGRCYLYEYDPQTHKQRRVLDMAKLIGQKPGDYGHGKLHGRIDEMADGWLYMATYWGIHPHHMPKGERNAIGGRLVRYNVLTDQAEDLGTPMRGDSFPMHATDTRRGIFHAIGLLGGYLAIDLHTMRPLYNGPLPGDVTWDLRATMVDPKTGCCYGSELHTRRIVGYNPTTNEFFKTRATMPQHPIPSMEKKPFIRAYTDRRLLDGSIIAQTYDGVMFKFFPDEERTEYLGLNWDDGLYSTSMALSQYDKYLYYCVGAHGQTWQSNSPIIQLDTETGRKKVLAFLHPFYQDKYGYVFGGTYSISLTDDGSKLLIFWNGRFRSSKEDGDSFGHPSFMTLEIPASERHEPRPGFIYW